VPLRLALGRSSSHLLPALGHYGSHLLRRGSSALSANSRIRRILFLRTLALSDPKGLKCTSGCLFLILQLIILQLIILQLIILQLINQDSGGRCRR
jgi:hypothetical protein